jgi:hypothetical protein
MSKEEAKRIKWLLYLIIIVAVVAALLGFPQWLTNALIQWLVSAVVGSVFSLVAASIVEAFTSNLLKSISWTIEIGGVKFSVTAFAIAVFVVKLALFHQI